MSKELALQLEILTVLHSVSAKALDHKNVIRVSKSRSKPEVGLSVGVKVGLLVGAEVGASVGPSVGP